jgi:AcrR family transcriptional regulator
MSKTANSTRTAPKRARAAPPTEPLPLRERILNAAFSSFMEKGYAGTSTLDIATRAKVSKRDLYTVCADKATLLRETITERAKRMRLPLELRPVAGRKALEETLTAFGAAILRGVSEKPVLTVYRLAIAESSNAPDVAKALEVARNTNRAALSRTLVAAQEAGLIKPGDPAQMVTDFLGLLWGDLLLQLLLQVADQPSTQAIDRMAQRTTKSFLHLYGSVVR